MNSIEPMLRLHPQGDAAHSAGLAVVLDTLSECAETCTACADACLAEEHVHELRRCIRLDLDCADVCMVTARLLARQTQGSADLVHELLHTCILACELCAEECEHHAEMHEHCRVCAEACRDCQRRCNFFLGEHSSSGLAAEDPDDFDVSQR